MVSQVHFPPPLLVRAVPQPHVRQRERRQRLQPLPVHLPQHHGRDHARARGQEPAPEGEGAVGEDGAVAEGEGGKVHAGLEGVVVVVVVVVALNVVVVAAIVVVAIVAVIDVAVVAIAVVVVADDVDAAAARARKEVLPAPRGLVSYDYEHDVPEIKMQWGSELFIS